MSQEQGGIAEVGSCMKGHGARYSTRSQFQIPSVQWKRGPVGDRCIGDQWTKKIARRFRHTSDVDGDRFQLNAADSGRLPKMQNGVKSCCEVFFQTPLEFDQIDGVASSDNSRRQAAVVEKRDQRLPAGVQVPTVVWLEGR